MNVNLAAFRVRGNTSIRAKNLYIYQERLPPSA